jgi:alcohol dehydrogenase class IV
MATTALDAMGIADGRVYGQTLPANMFFSILAANERLDKLEASLKSESEASSADMHDMAQEIDNLIKRVKWLDAIAVQNINRISILEMRLAVLERMPVKVEFKPEPD